MSEDKEKRVGDMIDSQLKASVQSTLDEGVPDRFAKLIDENLKKAFGESVDEEVPDRFQNLMERLKVASGEHQR